MDAKTDPIDLRAETEALLDCLSRSEGRPSVNLARPFVADKPGALKLFGDVLAA